MNRTRPTHAALAALLAACVWLLGLIAAVPALHEWICAPRDHLAATASADTCPHHGCAGQDAPAPEPEHGHACAVTLLASGVEFSFPPAFDPAAITVGGAPLPARTAPAPAPARGAIQARAPPGSA